VTQDDLLRAGAVVAAVALIAAPYWQDIRGRLIAAASAAKAHRALVARIAAAALLIAAAWGKVPMPAIPQATPAVQLEAPSVEMQRLVEPIGKALAVLPMSDRMLWAQTWNKVAIVAKAEGIGETVVFTETPSLRLFTVLAIDIAWRRIGNHSPGSVPGLREGVESALNAVIGKEVVPVTPEMRARYAEVAQAIAWAGVHGG
jgi:hypothetical protein